MVGITQEKRLFAIGCVAFLLLIGSTLLFLDTTIILSLIPNYLSKSGLETSINNNPSVLYRAVYATNWEDVNQLMVNDISLLPDSLKSQIDFPSSTILNIFLSKFVRFVSIIPNGKEEGQENACDYDTDKMMGDRYIIQIETNDPEFCRTEDCLEKFQNQITFHVQQSRSLTLPFILLNRSNIEVSMKLCKFQILSSVSTTCNQNEDETDNDCSNLQYTNRYDFHQTCLTTTDCEIGICSDGICLDESVRIFGVCQILKTKISSNAKLLYPSDLGYNQSISHFLSSSTTQSICSVEPDTVDDVAMILKILGRYRVPFAIKGGGHTYHPGFSSTKGIHISMEHFQKVVYHRNNQTVDMGAGLIWDDVHRILEPYNVNVIGGQASGVGVAGLILGGGYSWKTNQYGLAIDNVFEYELVTPNGTIVYVNNNSYPDIFFGLKGGFNNFGIVTQFNVRAVPQTYIHAGLLFYPSTEINFILEAVANFQTKNKDPKAQIAAAIQCSSGQLHVLVYIYYDASIVPSGTFDELLSIPHTGSPQTQSYYSFFKTTYVSDALNTRVAATTVSITNITSRFLNGLLKQLDFLNQTLGSKVGSHLEFIVEPFISTVFDNSQGGAYPHVSSSTPLLQCLIALIWQLPSDDEVFSNALKLTQKSVLQLAIDDGQDVGGTKQIKYPNYAHHETPVSQIYGDNLDKLRQIRKAWDPNNVMYLTGGFKF